MTNQKITRTRNQVARYLKAEGIPFIKDDSVCTIFLLKANSQHHYCALEFFPLSDEYYEHKKPFKFYRVWASNLDLVKKMVKYYLSI